MSDDYAECGKPADGGPCRMPAPHAGAHIAVRLHTFRFTPETFLPLRPGVTPQTRALLTESARRLGIDLTEQESTP